MLTAVDIDLHRNKLIHLKVHTHTHLVSAYELNFSGGCRNTMDDPEKIA